MKSKKNKNMEIITINRPIKNLKNDEKKTEKKDMIDIEEYLSEPFQENDFDEVIDKDKRSFCEYFCQIFKENQIFINTFFIKEELRPLSLKCVILIMYLELFFIGMTLSYDENYLAEIYYSQIEETFFRFIVRRFTTFIFLGGITEIISNFCEFFFIEDKIIKRIFKRNKNDEIKIKDKISTTIRNIKIRFILLIIFSFLFTIICFIYISCFNIAYPYIKYEWIKSSLFVLICNQFYNFFISLIQSVLRYIGIKCNSERIFKLSLAIEYI